MSKTRFASLSGGAFPGVNLHKHNMIRLTRPSSAVSALTIQEVDGVNFVTAAFKSGDLYTYGNINGGDIENLLSDATVSVGKWVNQVCKGLTAGNEVTSD